MKIRKRSSLVRFYAGPEHPIDKTSPEYQFLDAVCRQDLDEVRRIFFDRKLFGDEKSAVDAPYGRFTGIDGICDFTQHFNERFGAESSFLVPAVQTIANGRACLEYDVNFVIDGIFFIFGNVIIFLDKILYFFYRSSR